MEIRLDVAKSLPSPHGWPLPRRLCDNAAWPYVGIDANLLVTDLNIQSARMESGTGPVVKCVSNSTDTPTLAPYTCCRMFFRMLKLGQICLVRGRTLFAPSRPFLAAALLLMIGHCAWGADPQVNLSSNQMKFSAQTQGTESAPKMVVLTNTSQAELSINGITISGGNSVDFAQTNNCPLAPGVLAALARCEISVRFTPTLTGTLSAALNIADNASGSPQAVNLEGNATAPGPVASLAPASLAFGDQPEGTPTNVRVIILTNAGSTALSINSEISINGPASNEFHIQAIKSSCPAGTWQLAPKTSCDIAVVFAPTTIGVKSAQVSIADDAGGNPHSIELSGTGIPPKSTLASSQ
jgi:hypothetical protein